MPLTPATYRCRRNAPLLGLLECDRAEANRRVNAAVKRFISTQCVIPSLVPLCYNASEYIGTGSLMGFFRALVAHWLLDHHDVPFPVAEEAQALAHGARADSYFRMLENCWRLVLALCAEWNESALPLSVGTAIGIVTKMAYSGYSLGYIRNVRTTIAFAHRFCRQPSPVCDERFEVFYDCVARRLGNAHPNAKFALPLARLREIGRLIYESNNLKDIQDWAILTLTYFSVFRRANVVDIQSHEVQPFESGVRIFLPRSKNDQHGRGHEVYIDPLPEEPALCPVRAILRWRAQLPDEGSFFRHMGRLATVGEAPLADRTISRILKRYVALVGLDPDHYSAQSLRAGLITEALLHNVGLVPLAQHTNHRSIVALAGYFRPGPENRMNIVRTIATTPYPHLVQEIAG